MNFTTQCWTCGEFITLVAAQLYAGLVICPKCGDLGVKIPECEQFPPLEAMSIAEEFERVCPY